MSVLGDARARYRADVEAVEASVWDRVSLPVRAQGVNRGDVLAWLGRDSLRGVYWLEVPTSAGSVRVFDARAARSWEDLELADTVGGAGAHGQLGRDANETWSVLAGSLGRLETMRDVCSGRADASTTWSELVGYLGPFCCDAEESRWARVVFHGEPEPEPCQCSELVGEPAPVAGRCYRLTFDNDYQRGLHFAAVCASIERLGPDDGSGRWRVLRDAMERQLERIEGGRAGS